MMPIPFQNLSKHDQNYGYALSKTELHILDDESDKKEWKIK